MRGAERTWRGDPGTDRTPIRAGSNGRCHPAFGEPRGLGSGRKVGRRQVCRLRDAERRLDRAVWPADEPDRLRCQMALRGPLLSCQAGLCVSRQHEPRPSGDFIFRRRGEAALLYHSVLYTFTDTPRPNLMVSGSKRKIASRKIAFRQKESRLAHESVADKHGTKCGAGTDTVLINGDKFWKNRALLTRCIGVLRLLVPERS